jgi:CO dehydrogenase/acetyl-CoA synthase beta subunit
MDKNSIDDVIHLLINTPVMNLILDDDFKTLNELKNYLKNKNKNITKKKLSEDNRERIFNESFEKSLKYNDKSEQLLFFSSFIFSKMNDEDFNISIYRYLRNFE